MGIACSGAQAGACDRVGLSVTLRGPAQRVDASIAGEELSLDDPEWSGERVSGGREIFAGFLEPAGPLEGATRGASRGEAAREVPVRVWILREGGEASTATFEVPVLAGWG